MIIGKMAFVGGIKNLYHLLLNKSEVPTMKCITARRFKRKGTDEDFNIPYGKVIESGNGHFWLDGQCICIEALTGGK